VRLRGLIRHETSLTSIGLGAQKAALAILDKEGDKDMKKRIRLVPFITFGPFAFIPLLLIGGALDYFVFNGSGICTLTLGALGFLLYVYAIVLSVLTLKTEKKAQNKAYDILARDYHITDDELSALKELFRLYNIQYVNDIILSSLELLYTILEIAIAVKGNVDV
jgi:Zn-dependent membrane protease YugP